jgi:hypothetical protein
LAPPQNAHDDFGIALLIAFGVVEEIDAVVVGVAHDRRGGVLADLLAKGDPCTKRKLGNPEAGPAQAAVFHPITLLFLCVCNDRAAEECHRAASAALIVDCRC